MLDRYTGAIWTAGRSASDNLYVNNGWLATGSPIRVKPVEVRLADQPLGNALPVVYDMQREPGLQYILIFGDVAVPDSAAGGSALPLDYPQTQIRRVLPAGDGRYRLQYLTAAGLIELAPVAVRQADLLIVATYLADAEGAPTATPLPTVQTSDGAEP